VGDERARREGGAAPIALAAVALGVLLIAIAQIWQAAGQKNSGAGLEPPGPVGSLESVQLTNGLVLYGTLEDIGKDTVLFDRVYEVDVFTQATNQTGQPPAKTSRLVRRHAQDWHGPGAMAIPIRQILFMEAVPSDSQAAKLIDADEASGEH
jgi:hypothetical protein